MKEAPIIPMFKFDNAGLPFKIHTIQWIRDHETDSIETAHSNDHYEIAWITAGKAKLYADLEEYSLGENSLYCIKPNQVHQLHFNEEIAGYILSFKDSFISLGEHEFDWSCQASLFQLFSSCQVLSIQKDIVADIHEIVFQINKEFANEYPFRTQMLRRYFKIFLIHLCRQFERKQQNTDHVRELELVKSFMELLEKNFKEKKMVADYAAQLSITPNYLNGIVKKNTSFSAGHHIRQRVVLEAKRLCRYSEAGMKEIAYSLGFADSCHFSKFFKSVSGMNFTDFKKQGLSYSLFSEQSLSA
jgi:YesN/AraC family two-component response regulator